MADLAGDEQQESASEDAVGSATVPTMPVPALGQTSVAETQALSAVTADQAGRQVGEFILLRQLGSGTMGEVQLARHRTTGKEVALKLITDRYAQEESYRQRFIREIALLTRLNHPHLVRCVDYGLDAGRPFLAMEHIPGVNLSEILEAQGALAEGDVLRLAIQVAQGLDYAYAEAGLIHRDIKPANILIAKTGAAQDDEASPHVVAKVIDFGLAKSVESGDQSLTMPGVVLGTPSYMSPEQIRGEPNLTFHTDMYALGATLFHLLTGQVPYPNKAPAMVMSAHLTQPVPDPGQVKPGLNPLTRTLVMTAMAKRTQDRFPDYAGLIRACEKALWAIGSHDGTTLLFVRRGPGSIAGPATAPPPAAVPSRHDGGEPKKEHGSTSSMSFKPTAAVPVQGGALTGPQSAVADEMQPGTEALRACLSKKIATTWTTTQGQRRIQQSEEMKTMPAERLPLRQIPILARLRVVAPWLLLAVALGALSMVVLTF